ncbi:MAG: biotin/lipoyl-binding protein [Eubacterium sp.]|nr:biotin/lipoyl-binding protein [Eubacterium sp.]
MKSYTITVNGKVYDVTVEENGGGSAPAVPASSLATPAAAPAPAPAPASSAAGSISLTAKAAGKVVDIVTSAGSSVKKGDTVVILEIMKMETPVVAEADGTIASIAVSKGQSVAAGDLLLTMN